MSDVIEQGATRRLRPGDFMEDLGPARRNPNPPPGRYRPNPRAPQPVRAPRPGEPGYVPRNPRPYNPLSPADVGKYLSDVGPEAARDMLKLGGMVVGGRIGVALRALSWALTIADLIDWDWFRPKPKLHSNLIKLADCGPWDGTVWTKASGHQSDCGGYGVVNKSSPYVYRDGNPTFSNADRYVRLDNTLGESATQIGVTLAQSYYFNSYVTGVGHVFTPAPYIAPDPMLNPNLARAMPTLPALDFDTDPEPEPSPQPEPTSAQPSGAAVEVMDGSPVRRITVSGRRPPRKNEVQAKAMSNSAKLGVALFKVLDDGSEASEVVDAIYKALPAAVRKKWGCDQIKRGLLDSAGQYGIDAADCKAKAIYHNAHNIDIQAAVENVMVNYLQDKVIGSLYRSLPRNVGNAVGPGVQAVNKGFEAVVDAVLSV